MEVRIQMTGIKEAMELFDPNKVHAAARSAINKTADQTKTFASRQIRTEFNVPAGKLNQFLKITTRSRGNDLQAVITGHGQGMALSYFGPKQMGVQVSKKSGFRYTRKAKSVDGRKRGGTVTVEVRKGNRKAVIGNPQPFLTILKSGHIAIMQRTGSMRLPVKQLLGPGIGGLFGSRLFMPRIIEFANEKFAPIFQHELGWRLSK